MKRKADMQFSCTRIANSVRRSRDRFVATRRRCTAPRASAAPPASVSRRSAGSSSHLFHLQYAMGLLLILAVAALVGAASAQIGAEHCEWDNLGGREIHTDWYPCVQPRFAGQSDCDWPGYYWSFTNNGDSDVLDEGSVMCVDGWTQTSPSTSPVRSSYRSRSADPPP